MQNHYNYEEAANAIEKRGRELFPDFKLYDEDKPILQKLLCYFLQDDQRAAELGLNLNKGILLTGPIGCGKSSLISLMRFLEPVEKRFIIRSCREVSFEFIQNGYEVIHRYSHRSFYNHEPKTYCFDDLGTENNLKFFGNECNIMAEILLSRYDLFVSRNLITHLTTNLSATEIEAAYGNRVRSRMRELFNLIAFDKTTKDKRK